MVTLKDRIAALKIQIGNYTHNESNITASITAENTGEVMDSCNNEKCKLVKPFEDGPEQDYYYFLITVKPKFFLQVKSPAKILK